MRNSKLEKKGGKLRIVSVAPTLIGSGIPLFKQINFEFELKLKGIRRFNQFAELHYELS